MIEAYLSNTSNGQRVAIMLEETRLEHRVHYLNLFKREHRRPEYLAINPAGLIPAIVDNLDGKSTTVTQTAAILIHLANKAKALLPLDADGYTKAMQWLFFQVNELTAVLATAGALMRHSDEDDRVRIAKVLPLLKARAFAAYEVMDARLGETPYLAGDSYSIVDIMAYPMAADFDYPGFEGLRNISNWKCRIAARPPVQRATDMLREMQER